MVACIFDGNNFLDENHRGSPTLTLLNVYNVLDVLNTPKDTSLAMSLERRLSFVFLDHSVRFAPLRSVVWLDVILWVRRVGLFMFGRFRSKVK